MAKSTASSSSSSPTVTETVAEGAVEAAAASPTPAATDAPPPEVSPTTRLWLTGGGHDPRLVAGLFIGDGACEFVLDEASGLYRLPTPEDDARDAAAATWAAWAAAHAEASPA